ncbi:hypothetical protein BV25DRAFT_1990788 [Artomyces pyxidatus]|uniref:Uncharacterized protein n=1 Tax=Artomyces pyxidatus TaxID=48021 RepID=A0ACB8T3V5_9AGAM|nr:hypothetical protein BV25DRAFT_1990788 [Artomyces pyxidatus]
MLGQSLPEYIFIRISIAGLRLIAPASIAYLASSWYAGEFLWSRTLGVYAVVEALFCFLVYFPRRVRMQQMASHPPLMSPAQRRELFDKCVQSMTSTSTAGWFTSRKGSRVRRGNAMDWLLWGLFSTHSGEMLQEWEEELDYYASVMGGFIGYDLDHGSNPEMQCLRLTLDPVVMVHRPFIWYMIVGIVDTLTSGGLLFLGFRHYNTQKWFHLFPPRPLHALFSNTSPDPDIPYWYRPHRSTTKLPILFIHGIGIGLYPYRPFFSELIKQDPDVGILAIEILPVSMHMTSPPLSREGMCAAIARILDAHNLPRVVVASHSYGTVITAHLHHSPTFAPRIAGTLLVDPIPFLLHHPAVAFNFVYRTPREANEWQLWYFASRDADIARALARHFFWFENILFKDEIEGRRFAVSLAGRDQIVDAKEVRRYLTGEEGGNGKWKDGNLEVLYWQDLDHATVFDTKERRRPLIEIMGKFVRSEDTFVT